METMRGMYLVMDVRRTVTCGNLYGTTGIVKGGGKGQLDSGTSAVFVQGPSISDQMT